MKIMWNGFMKASHDGPLLSKIAIHFELMIDIPSTRPSCFYQTWLIIWHDPALTFDQPLYWKAMEITTREQQKRYFNKMVIMFGTFFTCMSFFDNEILLRNSMKL